MCTHAHTHKGVVSEEGDHVTLVYCHGFCRKSIRSVPAGLFARCHSDGSEIVRSSTMWLSCKVTLYSLCESVTVAFLLISYQVGILHYNFFVTQFFIYGYTIDNTLRLISDVNSLTGKKPFFLVLGGLNSGSGCQMVIAARPSKPLASTFVCSHPGRKG